MRGPPDPQLAMLTSLSTEELIPVDHPIRRIRVVVDAVLAELDDVFDGMYAQSGRSSVPPETLLKATVLMALYSIRSERAFCERLENHGERRALVRWRIAAWRVPAPDAANCSSSASSRRSHGIRSSRVGPSERFDQLLDALVAALERVLAQHRS